MKKKFVKIAVTGPRPENMGDVPAAFIRSSMRDTLEVYLKEYDGNVVAYSGMARGVDTIFATQAMRMGIPLIAAIPFKGFDSQWSEFDKKVLSELLCKAYEIHYVCEEGSKAAYQRRNEFMVDGTNRLLAYHTPGKSGGTANCMEYAKSKQKTVHEVDITQLFLQLDKTKWS